VNRLPGGLGEVVPPVPIPNTVVKRFSADDTEGVTSCGKYATARKLKILSLLVIKSGYLADVVPGRKKWQVDLRNFQSEPEEYLP
jgi:hypothetical protein